MKIVTNCSPGSREIGLISKTLKQLLYYTWSITRAYVVLVTQQVDLLIFSFYFKLCRPVNEYFVHG